MKTRTCIPLLTLIALFMVSCTSSLQVSNTSSWNDEIYGTSAKPQTTMLAANDASKDIPEKKVNSDLSKLEQKYSDVLEINMDSIKNDTVLYKAEETNPYERVLSDSYEDSYERRLRGLKDPRYGVEDWSVYYSDDYRYAQSYDPNFYKIVIMGSQVWVEPLYIYNSFYWPNNSWTISWNWGYWGWYGSNHCWAPYSYLNDPWYHSPWYYSSSYWNGWYDSQYYWNKYLTNNSPYYYGRRSMDNTENTYTRRTSGINNDDIVTTRLHDGRTASTTNAIESTRRTQTRVTPTYESTTRREGSSTDQTVTTRRAGGTRNDGNVIRTERPTREIGITEPTRRTYNPTYERPRTTSGGEYTRRTDRSSNNENSITRQPSTTNRTSTTPTYNRPSRVNTPSSTSGGNDNYRTRSSENRSSGSSNSSYSPSRSSSSSSSSGSSSSSSSSSSGSSSRRR